MITAIAVVITALLSFTLGAMCVVAVYGKWIEEAERSHSTISLTRGTSFSPD